MSRSFSGIPNGRGRILLKAWLIFLSRVLLWMHRSGCYFLPWPLGSSDSNHSLFNHGALVSKLSFLYLLSTFTQLSVASLLLSISNPPGSDKTEV